MTNLLHSEITGSINEAFYRVYRTHGYGFAESVYANSMVVALCKMGIDVRSEFPVEVLYEGVPVGTFRFDLLVARCVIVEVKCSAVMQPVDRKQVINYLKASDIEVGMLLNFGAKPEFKRLVFSNAAKRQRTV